MAREYGISRLFGEHNSTIPLFINPSNERLPSNLNHLRGTDIQLMAGFFSSVTRFTDYFGFGRSEALLRAEDPHNNEYGLIYVKKPEQVTTACCAHPTRCPYIDGVVIETASYKYDNLFTRFFKTVAGKRENIVAIRPVEMQAVDLFNQIDPFEYGEHAFESVHDALTDAQKSSVCSSGTVDVECDLEDLKGLPHRGAAAMKEYSPVGTFIIPFCEYLPVVANPGVATHNQVPPLELFTGWIGAFQSFFNEVLGIRFKDVCYQTPQHAVYFHGSRRNSLFGMVGGPAIEDTRMTMGEIAYRVASVAESRRGSVGAADSLSAIFDQHGQGFEAPEMQAPEIVGRMHEDLAQAAQALWEGLQRR